MIKGVKVTDLLEDGITLERGAIVVLKEQKHKYIPVDIIDIGGDYE